MLGIAASRSTMYASGCATRRGAMCVMKRATATASGTAMITATVAARMVPKARGAM